MQLSEFLERLRRPELADYAAYLASPDPTPGDTVDVQLVPVGDIEHDYESEELRLFPASAGASPADELDYEIFGLLLEALQREIVLNDPRVVVELPLFRDEQRLPSYGFTELRDVHVAEQAEEIWLLVRPREEFPADSLPA